MSAAPLQQALEYRRQLGSNASYRFAKSHSQTNGLRYPRWTNVGTLTLACFGLILFPRSSLAKTIRVMTYNIHVGVGMDKKLDLPRIAAVINKQHPDLVGLQEVDRGVERTQR